MARLHQTLLRQGQNPRQFREVQLYPETAWEVALRALRESTGQRDNESTSQRVLVNESWSTRTTGRELGELMEWLLMPYI